MRNGLKDIQWCPGCGQYTVLAWLKQAIKELKLNTKDIVVVSGIGCSGKFSQYVNSYGAETLHWRWLAFASWVKLANPNLTVISIGGDWDTYWIWLNHFLQTAKRNTDILHIVVDNENYALTTWQASPTTPQWAKTKSTPKGKTSSALEPVKLAEAVWCKFSKDINAKDIKEVQKNVIKGITHKWFAHLNIKANCVWNKWS